MSKLVIICAIGFLIGTLAVSFNIAYGYDAHQYGGDAYQVETMGGYEYFKDEDDYSGRLYKLGAMFHFEQVHAGEHPLAEADFLERVGGVSLLGGIAEYDFGDRGEAEGPVFGAGVVYTQPGHSFYLSANFTKLDADFEPTVEGKQSNDVYGLEIGMFLKDGLLVTFGYERSYLNNKPIFVNSTVSSKIEYDVLKLFSKWVHEMGDGTAVNAELNLEGDPGLNTIVEVAGDYYLNPRTNIGAGLALNTGNDESDEGKTFELRFGVFLTQRFSIGIDLEKFFADNDSGEDERSMDVTLLARF